MESKKFVVYGTGSAAYEAVTECGRENCMAVVCREKEVFGQEFYGIPLEKDDSLTKISEPFQLVIASQYFNIIYERLEKEGKLLNQNIENVLVPNLLGREPEYDEADVLPIFEEEYAWLFELLEDTPSRKLLERIKKERSHIQYPSYRLIPYEEGIYHAGIEDYWGSIPANRKNSDAIVVDAGAYIGDTIENIACNVGGQIKKYYALEPMEANYNILKNKNISVIDEFIPMQVALGNECGEVFFAENESYPDACFVTNKQMNASSQVHVVTLDSLGLRDKADYFVKMDIEGSEMNALRGGRSFISEMRPNLAICVYHKSRDIIEIPKYLKSLISDYKFYLVGGSHTILIAE